MLIEERVAPFDGARGRSRISDPKGLQRRNREVLQLAETEERSAREFEDGDVFIDARAGR